MKKQFKLAAWALVGVSMFFITSCKKEKDPVVPETPKVKEGIQRSELIFTEAIGDAHGDHFHGLGNATGGTQKVIKFDENGKAVSGGHLHLDAEGVYKIELKAWDYTGKEVQNDYIASKEVADKYKAFLVGGNFILNSDTEEETGAIFQPRETQYGDGTTVSGTGGIGTTGIISYFTAGHDNEGEKDVTFVLRRLNTGVKETIKRIDWNHDDYATKFGGQDVLKLSFEIHTGHH
jgi:hypothetical protein